MGKVRKNSAGITYSLYQLKLVLQQWERCPSVLPYTGLDNKQTPCTGVIKFTCPQVSIISSLLPVSKTNSRLHTVVYLCMWIISLHIFIKQPNWYYHQRSSFEKYNDGLTNNSWNTRLAIKLSKISGVTVSRRERPFLFFSSLLTIKQ